MRGSWDLISNKVTVNEGDFLNYIGAYKRLSGLKKTSLFDIDKEVVKYKEGMKDSNLSLWQKESFIWKASCQETKSLSELSQLINTVLQKSSIPQIT